MALLGTEDAGPRRYWRFDAVTGGGHGAIRSDASGRFRPPSMTAAALIATLGLTLCWLGLHGERDEWDGYGGCDPARLIFVLRRRVDPNDCGDDAPSRGPCSPERCPRNRSSSAPCRCS